MMRRSKKERQRLLAEMIEANPFVTDDDLAREFGVSVQTVRLDRLELSIPELRERIKLVASQSLENEVRSLPIDEVIGDIVDIELDRRAVSVFDVKEEHVFQRNGIARGHHLFAQANSLAVAVIDDELALTVNSSISFKKPVHSGDRVIAKAIVTKKEELKRRTFVDVTCTVENEVVLTGHFEMYRTKEESLGD
ncbi:transcription factor FapR [Chungangia koreensis]|uniref:Transcription factor FapR n=1 Tax=Chungangia koreensis TaxID=752657 RepID=A0ABV8X5B6_9LACT